MKSLFISVFLLSFVILFITVATESEAAPVCGDEGVVDWYTKKYCSCFSGYAPSTLSQVDCDSSAGCPAYESIDSATVVGGYPPFLYNATFSQDHLNIVIRIPIVTGRLNSSVTLQSAPRTCGYPGNLWYKKANSLSCFDEVYGSIPWSAHSLCGFSPSSSTSKTTTFNAGLFVTHDDIISDPDGDFVRTSGVVIHINVTFVTQITIIHTLVNLDTGNTFVKVVVVGNVIFDANSDMATVTLDTITNWPYEVFDIEIGTTPSPFITATLDVDSLYDVEASCNNVSNTVCTQQYVMRINPGSVCDIGGLYSFNITLICREVNEISACSGAVFGGGYAIRLYDTDVCGTGSVSVELSNGQLVPFSDQAGTVPKSNFLPNDAVYFAFTLESDAVTIDSLVVQYISVQSGTNEADVLYNLYPAAGQPGITTQGVACNLQLVPALLPAAPGVDATLWFNIVLSSTISAFQVLPNSATTVSVTIIVNVGYYGNDKRIETRTIVATLDSTTSSQGQAQIYISQSANTGGNLQAEGAAQALQPSFTLIFGTILCAIFMMLFKQ